MDTLELDPETDEAPRKITFGKVVLGLVVAASFGIWAYAYSGLAAGDRPFTGTMDDTSFTEQAVPICTSAMDELAAQPNAITAASAAERADQLDVSNRILSDMVDELTSIDHSTATKRDQDMASQWLEEYRIYVGDRERWADELRVDPTARITYTNLGTGLIEKRLTWFSQINNMAVCETPGDIG